MHTISTTLLRVYSCRRMLRHRPILSYFALTFCISWSAAFVVAAPHLLRGLPVSRLQGLMMFPAMLLGPVIAGLLMTWAQDGKRGLNQRVRQWIPKRGSVSWLPVLAIPPVLISIVLFALRFLVNGVFAPNLFLRGLAFGAIAGFVEEIGWTGFAFPAMSRSQNALRSAIILGLLWSLWHLPVIDFLGSATPHQIWLLPYFLAFTSVMTAMRVLICWVYTNTRGILFAQLMHAASTGALVVLSPPHVTALQETYWYLAYATALWIVVAAVVQLSGAGLAKASQN